MPIVLTRLWLAQWMCHAPQDLALLRSCLHSEEGEKKWGRKCKTGLFYQIFWFAMLPNDSSKCLRNPLPTNDIKAKQKKVDQRSRFFRQRAVAQSTMQWPWFSSKHELPMVARFWAWIATSFLHASPRGPPCLRSLKPHSIRSSSCELRASSLVVVKT